MLSWHALAAPLFADAFCTGMNSLRACVCCGLVWRESGCQSIVVEKLELGKCCGIESPGISDVICGIWAFHGFGEHTDSSGIKS